MAGKRDMKPRPSPDLRVRAVIQELAHGGDGVAVIAVGGERRAVFVPNAAPGDHALLSVDLTTRPAAGHIVSLERAGPHRIDPICPYSLECGGCGWMHLSAAGQDEAHRQQLLAALPEAWKSVPLELHAPREPWGYRTRARLHARASGGRAVVGLQEAKSHEVVEVARCLVLHPELDRARLALSPLLEGAHGRGEAQIAFGVAERPVLELRWRGKLAPATFSRLEDGVKAGSWAGARVFEGEVSRPAVFGDPSPWTVAADAQPLRLAPGGFAQASDGANAQLGERLLALALRFAAPRLGAVVELFAGAGNFTVLLARHAGRVVAVESSEPACEALRQNLAARDLRAKVAFGLAEEHATSRATHLVVLDPPRTGAKLVAERLVRERPRVVAYVSCDVPTLARDLRILAPAYDPAALESFAMFPHTPHSETLAVLTRKEGASS